jgi:hypothetical protein
MLVKSVWNSMTADGMRLTVWRVRDLTAWRRGLVKSGWKMKPDALSSDSSPPLTSKKTAWQEDRALIWWEVHGHHNLSGGRSWSSLLDAMRHGDEVEIGGSLLNRERAVKKGPSRESGQTNSSNSCKLERNTNR